MEYQVGDLVVISPNLADFDPNEWPGINSQMIAMSGEIDTISSFDGCEVRLRHHGWKWLAKWIEPYCDQEDIDFVPQNLNSIL